MRFLALTLGILGLAVPVAAQTASVSANDLLRLQVMGWDPVEETVDDWPALAGEYRVAPDGTLDVPFIGSIQAAGHGADEIAAQISEALGDRFALTEPPDATLTIEEFRPIVVSGLVRDAGEVDFSPGMTVRHAIALAGGPDPLLRRGSDAFRDMVNTEGRLQLLALEKMRLEATLARLRAERNGRDEITPPPGLEGPRAERLLSEEAEILKSRRNQLAADRQALNEQIDLLEAEISSLEQQVTSIERQRSIAREAREGVSSLASDGLVANNRLLESERALVSIENQLLNTSTALLRARQGLASTNRELDTIESDRVTDVIEQMIELEARHSDVEQEIETASRLADIDDIRVAEMIESGMAATPVGEPSYRIYRLDGTELEAEPGTVLQPGDLVEMIEPETPGRLPGVETTN